MQKTNTYKQLEEKLVMYRDLINISVEDNGTGFVKLSQIPDGKSGVVGRYETLSDMKGNFPLVPVRDEVKRKLDLADELLKSKDQNLQLVVAYGYRSLEIQQKYFEEQKTAYLNNADRDTTEDLNEAIHRLIAVPNVAGHPTGGAVDVYIEDTRDGTKLDFGVPIFTFDSKDAYTFSPFISKQASENRALLREVLMAQDFAPYDGEWWHFSYGDKEWAYYYKKSFAVYEQKKEQIVFDDVSYQALSSRKLSRIPTQKFYFQQ